MVHEVRRQGGHAIVHEAIPVVGDAVAGRVPPGQVPALDGRVRGRELGGRHGHGRVALAVAAAVLRAAVLRRVRVVARQGRGVRRREAGRRQPVAAVTRRDGRLGRGRVRVCGMDGRVGAGVGRHRTALGRAALLAYALLEMAVR